MDQLFKDTVFDMGDITLGSKGNEAFWEFDSLTKEDIAYDEETNTYGFKAACGCTLPQLTDTGLKAKYNDGGNNYGPGSKSITIYLKDGDKPLYVDGAKKRVLNDELPKVVLTLKFNRSKPKR